MSWGDSSWPAPRMTSPPVISPPRRRMFCPLGDFQRRQFDVIAGIFLYQYSVSARRQYRPGKYSRGSARRQGLSGATRRHTLTDCQRAGQIAVAHYLCHALLSKGGTSRWAVRLASTRPRQSASAVVSMTSGSAVRTGSAAAPLRPGISACAARDWAAPRQNCRAGAGRPVAP